MFIIKTYSATPREFFFFCRFFVCPNANSHPCPLYIYRQYTIYYCNNNRIGVLYHHSYIRLFLYIVAVDINDSTSDEQQYYYYILYRHKTITNNLKYGFFSHVDKIFNYHSYKDRNS